MTFKIHQIATENLHLLCFNWSAISYKISAIISYIFL